MKRIILAALAVVVLGAQKAEAEPKVPVTVQEYLDVCSTQSNPFSFYCHGVIQGIAFTAQLNGIKLEDITDRACIPKETTQGQLLQAFINWAKANPQLWQRPAKHLILTSLVRTWPCK